MRTCGLLSLHRPTAVVHMAWAWLRRNILTHTHTQHGVIINLVCENAVQQQCCRQAALGALQAWPGGLQLGGGVNTDNAKQYLDAGASHVIVTSFVFREGRLEEDRLKALVRDLCLVGGLHCCCGTGLGHVPAWLACTAACM